ncbi:hypothetical protein BCV69DRAFT_4217 [Microstroma glucosiphilum]|uniref:Uncharacterized protein n=1 Tax=Pseudomicrostroma glucosiphilum TaxID=1684307 RepID=A0A316UED8_9BASI|nr:hypothetical protein BCV69DRAFT_4217 [Pseudomicrostroma glucosiphilum]PWN23586.1 hypothetical protein BCV69DRAFT_4217 [Pseudomicrostroma glucosiphilum]
MAGGAGRRGRQACAARTPIPSPSRQASAFPFFSSPTPPALTALTAFALFERLKPLRPPTALPALPCCSYKTFTMASNTSIPCASKFCLIHLSLAKKDQATACVSAGPVEYCPECLRIEALYDAMSYGTPTPMEELSLLSDSGSESEQLQEPFRGKVLAGLPDNLFAPSAVPSVSSPTLPSVPTPAGEIDEKKPVENDVEECSWSYGPFCLRPDTGRNASFFGRELDQFVWPGPEWSDCTTFYSEGHSDIIIRRSDKANPAAMFARWMEEAVANEAAATAAKEAADLQECSFSFSSFCVIGDSDVNASFCGQDFQGKLDCPSDLDEIMEVVEQPEPTTPSSEVAPAPCKLLTVGAILTSTATTAIKSGNSSLIVPSKAMKRFIPKKDPRAMPQHAKHTEDASFALAELSQESMLIEKDINTLFELTCAAPSTLPTLAAKSKTNEDVSFALAQLSYESMIIDAAMGPLFALASKTAPVKTKRTAKKSANKDDSLPLPDISAGSLLLANCSAFRRELAAVGPTTVDINPLKAPKVVTKAVQTIKSKASALAKNSKTSKSTKSTAPTTATSVVGAKAKATPTAAKPLKGRTSAIVPPTKTAAPKVAAVKPRESSTPMVFRSRISIANAPKTTVAPKIVKAAGTATAPKVVKAAPAKVAPKTTVAPKATVAPKIVKAVGVPTAPKTVKATPKPVTAAATAAPRTAEARKGLKTAVKHSLPAPASKTANAVEWTPARKVKVVTAEDCVCKFSTPMRDTKRRTSPIWLRGSGTAALTSVQEKPLSLEDISFEAEVLMEDQDQDFLAFKNGATKQA